MGAYESVEKDTVAYGSRTWVHIYDAWVLWEGYNMVCMLLTGCTYAYASTRHMDVAKRGRSLLGVN
jgi:hypothetical protein